MTASLPENYSHNTLRRNSLILVMVLGILTFLTLVCGFQAMIWRNYRDEAANRREAAMSWADQLLGGSDRLTSSVRGYAASGDPFYLNEFQRELNLDRNRDQAVNQLLSLNLSVNEHELVRRAKQGSDALVHIENEAIEQARRGHLSQATAMVFGESYRKAKKSITDAIQQCRNALNTRLKGEVDGLSLRVHYWALAGLCLLIINSLATALVLTLFFWRRVIEPLTSLKDSLAVLLAGDSDAAFAYQDETSEVGDIARSLEHYRQATHEAEHQRWLKNQLAEIAVSLHSAQSPQEFASSLLSRITPQFEAGYAAFYCVQEQGGLHCWGHYGGSGDCVEIFQNGEGLVGQCQIERKVILLDNLPEGYVKIASGCGQSEARCLMLIPVLSQGSTLAVIELASFKKPGLKQVQMLEGIAAVVSLNLEILQRNLRTQALVQELKHYRVEEMTVR